VFAYAPKADNDPVFGFADGEMIAFSPAERVVAAWSQAIGAWGRTDSDGNAAVLKRSVGGLLSGLDVTFGEMWRLGVAGGYTHSSLHVPDRNSSAAIDSYHLAVYGGAKFGAFGLRTGVAHAWHDIDSSRNVTFAGGEGCCASLFSETTMAGYKARTAQAFGEVGYGFAVGRVAVEPFAGAAYVNVRTDGFTETGGAAALFTRAEWFDVAFATVGSRAAVAIAITDWGTIIARGTLGWRHAFGDVTPGMTMAFASGSAPFSMAGVPIARDVALIESGIELHVNPGLTVSVSYVGQLASRAQDHAVKGSLAWKF
jgi:outer membrane autotransporter protein